MGSALAGLVAVGAVLSLGAPAAQATKAVDRFFPASGVSGTLGGEFNFGVASRRSGGIAVRESTGQIYVADTDNHRVQRFATDGTFQRAWGVDVVDGVANPGASGDTGTGAAAEFEICTDAAHCKQGLSGGGNSGDNLRNGQLNFPQGIAVNQTTGDVYVHDRNNNRVNQYDADGAFVRSWGNDVVNSGPGNKTVDVNEQQSISVAGSFSFACFCLAPVTGGTFTLSFGAGGPGVGTTAAIDWDADAAEVDAALEAITNIGAGNVEVTGGPGTPWTVEFTGTLAATDVAQITGDGTGLFPAGSNVTVSTTVAGGTFPDFEICAAAADICKAGATGNADGQFGAGTNNRYDGTGISVDPVSNDVWVVDPGGEFNRRIQRFEADGTFVGKFGGVGTGTGLFGSTSSFQPKPIHLAVGADGIVYVGDCQSDIFVVERYDIDPGAWLDPITVGPAIPNCNTSNPAITALAIDPDSGNLFVAGQASEGILEYDVSGTLAVVDTHIAGAPGDGLRAYGLALASGNLHIASTTEGDHRVYVADDDGAPGTVAATLDPPTGVTESQATFAGTVDPDGFPVDYRFEYSKTGVEGDWAPVASDVALGDGLTPVDVPVAPAEGQATGLEACTLYRVRIVATRGYGNPSTPSAELTFATDCVPPDATTDPVISLDEDSAILRGTLNPNGAATTYWFEYGATAAYGTNIPVPSASAGASGIAFPVAQQIQSLAAETIYHYRLCATNLYGTECGDDASFVTLPTPQGGDSARAFERVSPAPVSGVGVGSWYSGIGQMAPTGFPAYGAERYLVEGELGAMLVDGPMAWGDDTALAGRVGDLAGWLSRPAMTRPAVAHHSHVLLDVKAASPQLDTYVVATNNSPMRIFPEIADWSISAAPSFVGDWQGRWEIVSQTEESQLETGANFGQSFTTTVVSTDGRAVVDFGPYHGVAGPGDPTDQSWTPAQGGRIAGRSVYLDDISAGLSDSFPGNGVRSLVNACTGGTMLPDNDAGTLGERACPPPLGMPAGPDATLISARGAALHGNRIGTGLPPSNSLKNIVSRDGARTFFISPDPEGSPPLTGCTTGTGDDTSCPPQLYVRQRNTDGSVSTRWISRAASGLFGTQSSSLMGPAYFEGATPDGGTVFFRTNMPLTVDDRNGTGSAPVTTGSPSDDSWDLYRYELPAGPDGDPATPDADPAGGTLTRVSRGPSGDGDCNSPLSGQDDSAGLRFLSDDGNRVYFTCADDLPGVPANENGTVTAPGGTPGSTGTTNLYVYGDVGAGESWDFVAQLPRSTADGESATSLARCASTGSHHRSAVAGSGNSAIAAAENANCFRGTSDGEFVTFWTDGRLTADDPDTVTGDLYAYDAAAEQLSRISRPQGGEGAPYRCSIVGPVADCYGDPGVSTGISANPLPMLGVVTEPAVEGQRTAFFESAARLVPEDTDDAYDVYQWQDGDLTLLTTGASDTDGAFYKGNSSDGKNVYFATRDRLSWQDTDAVLDIYTARVGGGIPQPLAAPVCSVLAGGCQGTGAGAGAVAPSPSKTSSSTGGDNISSGERKTLRVGNLSRKARRRAARSGIVRLRVRSNTAGRVSVVARGRVGKKMRRVGRASKRLSKPGVTRVNLRLNSRARRALKAGRKLNLSIQVRSPGARPRSVKVALRRAGR